MKSTLLFLLAFFLPSSALSTDVPPPLTELDFSDSGHASVTRDNLVSMINSNPNSPYTAKIYPRFANSTFGALLSLGAGVLGGDPRENEANLGTKTFSSFSTPASSIPDEFSSLVEWGKICPILLEVQDQSACGSCYAVSAASAATDRFCINSGGKKMPRLSEVDLMSCCFTCKGSNGGCYGGTPSHCWDYMTQQGIASGGKYGDKSKCLEYPFAPCAHHVKEGGMDACSNDTYASPTCFWKCDAPNKIDYDSDQAEHLFNESYKVDADVKAIQADILENGPSQASFFLVSEFEVYEGGVFSTQSTDYIGAHAVKIVGWGKDDTSGLDYWLVQNSWNSGWGEAGYFRIERGKNILNIEEGVVAGIAHKKS